ncbi:hypothetical protein C8J56DRAFT_954961 [Mycena floridula]|nr:hypothetical protein C8J56DRAFT_954961 [Mycena floridula]
MAEHRISASPSPGRNSLSLSRPDWPWSSSSPSTSSGSLLRHSYSRSSQPSSSTVGPNWSSSSNRGASPGPTPVLNQRTGSTMGYSAPSISTQEETSTKQWSFLGFEWLVRDVQRLRDHIELEGPVDGNAESSDQDAFEILNESPIPTSPKPPGLSLYITPLALDFTMPHYEIPVSLMVAIKCHERGARPEWVWEFWQQDFVFRQESEVFACPLPSLSALLENTRIRETDSMMISVQIQQIHHTPVGQFLPLAHPSAYYVPRDLLEGIEASLDNSNTGDVRFVCLERLTSENSPPASEATSPTTLRSPSSSSHAPFSGHTTARKRIIYAHSDILTRRSDYFATMLSASGFSETNQNIVNERKVYEIVVEEADFVTIYWLLKYCYANYLEFKEHDDVRAAVDGVGAGWSAKWLNHDPRGEWDWKTFTKFSQDDGTTATSGGDSVRDEEMVHSPSAKGKGLQPNSATGSVRSSVSNSRTSPKVATVPRNTTGSTPATPRRPTAASGGASTTTLQATRDKQVPVPLSIPHSTHFSNSQRRKTPDPHFHPTPAPAPCSALSMYHLAHRYAMPALSSLALEHIMSTITPESSFSLLLAASAWEEIHSMVEDYIVEKWDEVGVSDEFERCCQEVASGEWGPEGGTTLMKLFRRLRSPNALYVRS